MYKKKAMVLVAVAGLLGTTAAAGASGMIDKVSGLLRKDVTISVNGEQTSLKPVYINGQAYLPARGAAAALGYELNYNVKNKEIELKEIAEEEAQYMLATGVIVDVQQTDKGDYRIELLGKSPYSWVILYVDKDTALTDAEGKAFASKDLKAGMRIDAEFGPVMAMSYPGQSHAAKITVRGEALIKEEAIQSVERTDDGWQVKFGETKDGTTVTTLVLNAGKETSLLTSEGQPVEWNDLKAGTKVRAYYGPIMTKSLPPQSPLHYLVVLDKVGQLAPAAEQEFRELAWKSVPAEQKSHLTTKPEEAKVESIDAKSASVLTETEAQKQKLAKLQEANAQLITVTYNSDQETLIGPLVLAFDPDTKEFIGFFPRR